MEVPQTRYVTVGGSEVAYLTAGNAPFDLLMYAGVQHLEMAWANPKHADALTRLASWFRIIQFDRRGTGASERVPSGTLTWENWTEDFHAVLDAVGSTKVAIEAWADGGPVAILYAALHPDRVSHLILVNTSARYREAPDYPIGVEHDVADAVVEFIRSSWGTPEFARAALTPEHPDPEYEQYAARWYRASATPQEAAAYYRYMFESVDVRDTLRSVQAPCLVVHNESNPLVPLSHGEYLAANLPNSKLLVLPGMAPPPDNLLTDEMVEFVTGSRPGHDTDRVLTTILFTDIVTSTQTAAGLGDKRWSELLDQHDAIVNRQLAEHRGRKVNTRGDDVLAMFDGPARAVRCARAICDALAPLGVRVRTGVHTGEVELRGDDIGGIAVHIGQRISALADGGEVLVSRTVVDLVAGSGLEFDCRGDYELKGVPGSWQLFALRS